MNLKINSLRFFVMLFTAFIAQGNLIAQDSNLDSQLIKASKAGDLSQVQILIEKGVNVNAIDEYGWGTALIYAARNEHRKIVKILIENGANINSKDKYEITVLMWSAVIGDEKTVKLLIENGANVNAIDRHGCTALMFAADNGHEEIVKLLIENGANINAIDRDGLTVLMWAAKGGNKKTVKLLIENGANTNAIDRDGRTALMWTHLFEYEKIEKLLSVIIGAKKDPSSFKKQNDVIKNIVINNLINYYKLSVSKDLIDKLKAIELYTKGKQKEKINEFLSKFNIKRPTNFSDIYIKTVR